MTEEEEFEFRHRYEMEQAAAKPAPAPGLPPETWIDTSGSVPTIREGKKPAAKPDPGKRIGTKGGPAPADNGNFLGALETAATMATGATTGLVGGAAGLIGAGYNNIASLFSGAPMRDPGEAFSQGAQALTYSPRTERGQEMTQGAGQFLAENAPAAAAGPFGMVGMGTAGVGRGMMNAAKAGARNQRAVIGAAAGAAADAVTPTITPEMARLQRLAKEKWGIELQPHQLAPGRVTDAAAELAENMPLAGSKKEANRAQFRKAVLRAMNAESGDAEISQDAFNAGITRSGKKIGEVASKAVVPLKGKLQDDLNKLWSEAESIGQGDSPRVIPNFIKRITEVAEENGTVPGKSLREAISEVGLAARGAESGDLKNRLNHLQDVLIDAVERASSKEDFEAFKTARKEYAIAKQIEPIVAKMVDNDFSPAALMGRVTRDSSGKEYMAKGMGGDIGDLAKIGQRMKDPPSSGTAQRSLIYGVASGGTGAAAFAEPVSAAAALGTSYGLSNAYNRLGPRLSTRMANKALRTGPEAMPPPPPTTTLGLEGAQMGGPLAPPAGVWGANPALGDLTPDLGTSLGAAPGRPLQRSQGPGGRVGASGLYPALGQEPLVPPQGMALLRPDQYPGAPVSGLDFVAEPALQGLTPDLDTLLGLTGQTRPQAGPLAGPRPLGLVPTEVGLADQPMRVLPGGYDARLGRNYSEAGPAQPSVPPSQFGARPQMPAVPGRPDLPDSILFGPNMQPTGLPSAPTDGFRKLGENNAALLEPGAQEAIKRGAPKATPRANNASGESAASQEAINRVAREKASGQMRAKWSGGKVEKLIGPDAVDARVGPKEVILQRGVGKNKWTVLDQGKDVKKSDIARAIAEAEKKEWK